MDTIQTTKECTKCHKVLALEDFGPQTKRGKRGRCAQCRLCVAAYARGYRRRDPQLTKQRRKEQYDRFRVRDDYRQKKLQYRLQEMYNLTLEEFDDMVSQQKGLCAICRKPNNVIGERLGVDHDHNTGEVRGLLCNHCNKGLAGFRDNPKILKNAINYLSKGDI